jgi:phage terminase large subunit-like protein
VSTRTARKHGSTVGVPDAGGVGSAPPRRGACSDPAPWVRNPVDEIALKEGCYFDEEAGIYVCNFIEKYCVQSKGRWRGLPIVLMDWERDLLMRLFGWMNPDGFRRFVRLYLEIAKKNGKSTLLAALGVELLIADGEGSPEIHLNACDRDQAGIIYEEQREMVKASPALSKRLEIVDSAKRIVDPLNNGLIRANSKVVDSKDGRGPSAVIFDELHRQRDHHMWGTYKFAGAARQQFLMLALTTAGESEDGVWFDMREYSEEIVKGENDDTTHLGVVYRCDPKDDLDDPAVWKKANPSMGITINQDRFAREWKEAKRKPLDTADFMRFRFNIIMAGEAAYLPAGAWEACDAKPDVEKLKGREFCSGLDLSNINDLSAHVRLYGDADWGYDLLAHFWLPKKNILDLERQNNAPYRMWAEQGYITLTESVTIDYNFIRSEIIAASRKGRMRWLMIDPWNATHLAGQLREDDGLPAEYINQKSYALSPATKELQRLVLEGKIRHGGTPELAWMARNAVVQEDTNGNIRLSKKASGKKIDGIAATVNALAGWMRPPPQSVIVGPCASVITIEN